ncbi:MAG TPA: NAD(P)-dependent oxidoreductase [Solirubrobacterales bacterium]|nr:NAD(P)-dependent oxidoreductase [Solirubrobacterales bacterium]
MRIFVAGASGALGKQLVPRLVAGGHEVVGMTRSERGAELVRGMGARAAIADALEPESVGRAVSEAGPEAIVHQLTALSGSLDPRHFDRDFAATNRLRTEGTDHLLAAARAAGVRRFVAQSYAGWPYARSGGPVKSEEDPLDPDPPEAFRRALDAIRHLERAVSGCERVEGIVLRYGGFYGPGTSLSLDPVGEHVEAIRKRRFPIVGDGAGVWSFVHIADAAEATVAAVERGGAGILNVVDDDPAAVRAWLPYAAETLGAKPPRRVPRWLGRLLAGEAATVMRTEVRGASNERAKRMLGWQPSFASWRRGFAEGLG